MANGALGCSISGAGPTVFAWCEQQDAERIRDAMVAGFAAQRLASDAWISTWIRPARAFWNDQNRLTLGRPPHALHQHPQRRPRRDARRSHRARHRAGRRLVRSAGISALHDAAVRRPTRVAADRRAAAGAVREPAIRWPPSCPRSATRRSISRRRWWVCRTAPAPLSVLELFHGPTSAFKDFGARFLAACMERIRRGQRRKLTILVATSGDTGGAVAAAFHGKPWVDVVVLYPQGPWSPNGRRSSSRAGAATCGRSPCAARSTIASAS